MDSVKTLNRIELKAPLNYAQYLNFINFLKYFNSDFKPIFSERSIYNVYYDTIDLKLLEFSRQGSLSRVKVRLRNYNHEKENYLEFKFKNGLYVRKEIIEIAESPENLSEIQKTIISYSKGAHLLELGEPLSPVMQNSYRRQYFEHFSGIRMTLDLDLHFQATRFLPNIGSSNVIDSNIYAIVEWKLSPEHEKDFYDLIVPRFPFKLKKISKYEYGMSLLGW